MRRFEDIISYSFFDTMKEDGLNIVFEEQLSKDNIVNMIKNEFKVILSRKREELNICLKVLYIIMKN